MMRSFCNFVGEFLYSKQKFYLIFLFVILLFSFSTSSYRDVVECQTVNVRAFCGDDGLEFFDRYIGEMTGSLIKEHCIGYTYGGRCVKARPHHIKITDHHEHLFSTTTQSENFSPQSSTLCSLLISLILVSSHVVLF